MANAFKNKTQRQIGTSLTALESYTVAGSTERLVETNWGTNSWPWKRLSPNTSAAGHPDRKSLAIKKA